MRDLIPIFLGAVNMTIRGLEFVPPVRLAYRMNDPNTFWLLIGFMLKILTVFEFHFKEN